MAHQRPSDPTIPAGIKALGPEAAQRVREIVRDAEERQAAEAERAIAAALKLVPWPLRVITRKVLLG